MPILLLSSSIFELGRFFTAGLGGGTMGACLKCGSWAGVGGGCARFACCRFGLDVILAADGEEGETTTGVAAGGACGFWPVSV